MKASIDNIKARMINLEVGGFYNIKLHLATKGYNCRIGSKKEYSEIAHTYLIEMPHETGPNPYGMYIHDVGFAKHSSEIDKNKYRFWYGSTYPIVEWRELTTAELIPIEAWFKKRERERRAWIARIYREAEIIARRNESYIS